LLGVADPRSACDAGAEGAAGQRRLLESILVAGLLNATKKDFFTVTYRD